MLTYYLLTLVNFAQRVNADDVGVPKLKADDVLANTLNIVYFLAGAVSVIVLIVGAVMYTSSGGNASGITKGKGLITYAIVGLVVVFCAFMITNFVRGIFQ